MNGRKPVECPHCGKRLDRKLLASFLGRVSSKRKAAAAAENGKRGGRPKTAPPAEYYYVGTFNVGDENSRAEAAKLGHILPESTPDCVTEVKIYRSRGSGL